MTGCRSDRSFDQRLAKFLEPKIWQSKLNGYQSYRQLNHKRRPVQSRPTALGENSQTDLRMNIRIWINISTLTIKRQTETEQFDSAMLVNRRTNKPIFGIRSEQPRKLYNN